MRQIKIGLFFLVMTIFLTGCIKIPIGDGNSLKISKDGLTFSDQDGEESAISIDKNNESFSISSDGEEWEGSFGENVSLPDDFPVADLPIPKEANIISTQKMTFEEGDGSIVIYMYEGEIADLTKMYVDTFNTNGFVEVEKASLGDVGFTTISAKKNTNIYIGQLIEDTDHIQVSLMYGEEKE